MHSPAIWLSNHLYSNFKIWLYCLNKLFKISVLKIVINERRSQTSITHGAKFYCIFKLISAQPQGMFPHNPKLHYQEKMMGPLSSTIIMYAVPCWKKSGKDKELRLILKFSKYPSLRHRCAIINFVYQCFPDIKQKRFPYFPGAGTAVRTLASRARVWFPDMASHVG